jgi:hypothetical protein
VDGGEPGADQFAVAWPVVLGVGRGMHAHETAACADETLQCLLLFGIEDVPGGVDEDHRAQRLHLRDAAQFFHRHGNGLMPVAGGLAEIRMRVGVASAAIGTPHSTNARNRVNRRDVIARVCHAAFVAGATMLHCGFADAGR